MTPTLMVLIAAAIAILAYAARATFYLSKLVTPPPAVEARPAPRQPVTSVPVPAVKPVIKKVPAPPTAVSTQPPELFLLEWEPAEGAPPVPIAASEAGEELRSKLRDRYIAIRFPGVARSSSDLRDAARVIKGVRLYFGEQKLARAEELLDLAIGQAGSPKLLRLARLELAYLRRDAAAFTAFARDFRGAHPDALEWLEITRLGRALTPDEASLFGDAQGARAQDSYGPWPDMPNWLQASWDLTSEVLGADFHREMNDPRTPELPAPQCHAA